MFIYQELKREMDRLNNSIIDISNNTNYLLSPRIVEREKKSKARELQSKIKSFDKLLKNYLLNLHKDKIVRSYKGERKKYTTNLDKKYFDYMKRCCASGKEFSISQEYFNKTISKDCVYCGMEGGTIDRIDSKIGYTEQNCQPCCLMCNVMKMALSNKDFLTKVKQIYQNTYV